VFCTVPAGVMVSLHWICYKQGPARRVARGGTTPRFPHSPYCDPVCGLHRLKDAAPETGVDVYYYAPKGPRRGHATQPRPHARDARLLLPPGLASLPAPALQPGLRSRLHRSAAWRTPNGHHAHLRGLASTSGPLSTTTSEPWCARAGHQCARAICYICNRGNGPRPGLNERLRQLLLNNVWARAHARADEANVESAGDL